ncbi:villin [Anaeramoeba flamelloides]|uniref:Villin n=1 Tax=Anaeramoeba flamelloides TaxID=1746091 RepID=A0ABQ8Y3H6_9EUKA|nr:villin [Anaeramoeba flamelloides]
MFFVNLIIGGSILVLIALVLLFLLYFIIRKSKAKKTRLTKGGTRSGSELQSDKSNKIQNGGKKNVLQKEKEKEKEKTLIDEKKSLQLPVNPIQKPETIIKHKSKIQKLGITKQETRNLEISSTSKIDSLRETATKTESSKKEKEEDTSKEKEIQIDDGAEKIIIEIKEKNELETKPKIQKEEKQKNPVLSSTPKIEKKLQGKTEQNFNKQKKDKIKQKETQVNQEKPLNAQKSTTEQNTKPSDPKPVSTKKSLSKTPKPKNIKKVNSRISFWESTSKVNNKQHEPRINKKPNSLKKVNIPKFSPKTQKRNQLKMEENKIEKNNKKLKTEEIKSKEKNISKDKHRVKNKQNKDKDQEKVGIKDNGKVKEKEKERSRAFIEKRQLIQDLYKNKMKNLHQPKFKPEQKEESKEGNRRKEDKEVKAEQDKEAKQAKGVKEVKEIKKLQELKVVKQVKEENEDKKDIKKKERKEDKQVKQVKNEKQPRQPKEAKPAKQTKQTKQVKRVKEVKEEKEAKQAKPVKQTKQVKRVKEPKQVKGTKPVKEVKEVKQSEQAKPVKQTKQVKQIKQVKGTKPVKEVKEVKQSEQVKSVKQTKQSEQVKEKKEDKEVKAKQEKQEKQAKGVKEVKEIKQLKQVKEPKQLKQVKEERKEPKRDQDTFQNREERSDYFNEMKKNFFLSFQNSIQKKQNETEEEKQKKNQPKKLTHIKRPKRRNVRRRTNLKTDHLDLVDPKKAAGSKPKSKTKSKKKRKSNHKTRSKKSMKFNTLSEGIPINEIRNLKNRLKKTQNTIHIEQSEMLGKAINEVLQNGKSSNQISVNYNFKLYQIRGKKNIRITLVEPTIESLNKEDVFIIETKQIIYIWCGENSNRIERGVGLDFGNKIKTQVHSGRPKLVTLVDGENDLAEGEDFEKKKEQLRNKNFTKDYDQRYAKPFWKLFGGYGNKSLINEKNKLALNKLEYESWWVQQIELYQFQLGGELNKISTGLVKDKKDLDTAAVYVLVSCSGAFLWVGKKVKWGLRQESRKATQELTTRFNLPAWNPIKRNFENGEDPIFKQHFLLWPDTLMIAVASPKLRSNKARINKRQQFDFSKMLKVENKEEILPNDGSGKSTIWWVDQNNKYPLEERYYGHFCQHQSYLIHYKYVPEQGKEYHCLFFWQGRDSPITEKGASAVLTIEMDNNTFGGEAKQIRVPEGLESMFFFFTFDNSIIIHFGKNGKWDGSEVPFDTPALYQIKSENNLNCRIEKRVKISYVKAPELKGDPYKCRALQVPFRISSLNSFSCFLLITDEIIYLWVGKQVSNIDLQHCQDNVIPKFQKIKEREIIEINENDETEQSVDFYDLFFNQMLKIESIEEKKDQWKDILNQTNLTEKITFFAQRYFNSNSNLLKQLNLQNEIQNKALMETKLWKCRYEKGIFDIERIPVLQQLLKHDYCYIMDVDWAVFLWIGLSVKENSGIAKKSTETAIKYNIANMKKKSSGGDLNTNGKQKKTLVYQILGGHEPIEFVTYFWGWDDNIKAKNPRIKMKKRIITQLSKTKIIGEDPIKGTKVTQKYSFKALTSGNYPKNVDKKNLQDFLLDDEFEKLFKMSRNDFNKLPNWKKLQKKKQIGLF